MYRTFLFLMLSVSAACSSTQPIQPLEALEQTDADTVMVVIEDPRGERRRLGLRAPGYNAQFAYSDDPLLKRAVNELTSEYDLKLLAQWPLRNISVHCFVIERPAPEVLALLRSDKRVRWVQAFNTYETQSATQPEEAKNDRAAYAARLVDRFKSEVSERGKNVKIAVVDTGADQLHPDLRSSQLSVSDHVGRRGSPKMERHGTAVVGLIAARPGSPQGLSGIANDARVRLLRGCWENENGRGRCNTLTLALALDAAIDFAPDLLNLSLTGDRDRVLDELLAVLLEKGTLVVAAYDEKRAPNQRFPAPQPGVIYAYGPASDSVAGPMGDDTFYAPHKALSLTPDAGYDLASGHSIATPHLTAMAACMLDRHPEATREDLISRLSHWMQQDI